MANNKKSTKPTPDSRELKSAIDKFDRIQTQKYIKKAASKPGMTSPAALKKWANRAGGYPYKNLSDKEKGKFEAHIRKRINAAIKSLEKEQKRIDTKAPVRTGKGIYSDLKATEASEKQRAAQTKARKKKEAKDRATAAMQYVDDKKTGKTRKKSFREVVKSIGAHRDKLKRTPISPGGKASRLVSYLQDESFEKGGAVGLKRGGPSQIGLHPAEEKGKPHQSQKTIKARQAKGYKKGGGVQGYNARLDESLGVRNQTKKKQTLKSRRDESEAMEKKGGRRKFAAVTTMDKKKRTKVANKPRGWGAARVPNNKKKRG